MGNLKNREKASLQTSARDTKVNSAQKLFDGFLMSCEIRHVVFCTIPETKQLLELKKS